MIKTDLQNKINEALKAGDQIKVMTLRMLSTELHNAEIDKRGDLSEEEELVIVKKEIKKRKDAIEAYEGAGRSDKAAQEKTELEILQEYLPEEMGDDELSKIVDEAIAESGASSVADMGNVMGIVMSRSSNIDGGRASMIVREKLSEKNG